MTYMRRKLSAALLAHELASFTLRCDLPGCFFIIFIMVGIRGNGRLGHVLRNLGFIFSQLLHSAVTFPHTGHARSIGNGSIAHCEEFGLIVTSGNLFKLFNAGGYQGNFTSLTLPVLSGALIWTNRLAVNGTIAVISPVNTTPTNLTFSVIDGSRLVRRL